MAFKKPFTFLILISLTVLTSFVLYKSNDGTCTGDANCRVCTNCSSCGHCSRGGKCGVCAPPGYYKKTTSTKVSEKKPQKTSEELATDKAEFDQIKQYCKTKISENSSCSVIYKIGNCGGYECNENLYTISDGVKNIYTIAVYDGTDAFGKQMIIFQNLETKVSCKVSSIEKAFHKIESELNPPTESEVSTEVLEPSKKEIYAIVEEQAEFPGGTAALYKFIQKNIQYPQIAKENGLSGKCYLKFVVNTDGSLTDIIVLKGVSNCKECDDEAIRLVKLMPTWKPAKMGGKPVACYFDLPVSFKMQ